VVVSEAISPDRAAALEGCGCEVLRLPGVAGRPGVRALLAELGRRRMTNVLVEGGAEVFGSFHDAGLIDELHVYLAPKLIGGTAAPSPVGGLGIEQVGGERRPVVRWRHETSGQDLYVSVQFLLCESP
jgi:diaminohydroxyphosphoribosylaminopyrimidine deaminase/5-amino-6-(5-phosphoribosylamino)uracil reductase